MDYAELHAHSAYSFLDGASSPEEVAAAAAMLGYRTVALTDHDGIWGAMEFAHACAGLGVRAITGAELTVEGGSHLTLLVEDRRGYRNLCRLITFAHDGTRTRRGARVLPARDTPPCVSFEQLEQQAEGLVCLSGCAREGALARLVERGDLGGGRRIERRVLAA